MSHAQPSGRFRRRGVAIGLVLGRPKRGFLIELLTALIVRYPTVPIHFAETRPLAEEWTYRFLALRSPTPRPKRRRCEADVEQL